jgi:hypothetical protein
VSQLAGLSPTKGIDELYLSLKDFNLDAALISLKHRGISQWRTVWSITKLSVYLVA